MRRGPPAIDTVAIPAWNRHGVLPPINPVQPTSTDRSPYVVDLSDLVQRFGSSSKRLDILDGLIRYRAALHGVGLTRGFQWLDGSFVENIERLEQRPPDDLDVVTFYRLPDGKTQQDLVTAARPLFPQDKGARIALKEAYRIDAYVEHLGEAPERLVQRSSYWYSVWAHRRRDRMWKGFVQIDLAPDDDELAGELLVHLRSHGDLR